MDKSSQSFHEWLGPLELLDPRWIGGDYWKCAKCGFGVTAMTKPPIDHTILNSNMNRYMECDEILIESIMRS